MLGDLHGLLCKHNAGALTLICCVCECVRSWMSLRTYICIYAHMLTYTLVSLHSCSVVSPYVCITLKKLVRHQLSYEDIGYGRVSNVCRQGGCASAWRQPPREAWIVFPSDTHHRGSRNVWVLAVIYEIISLAIMKPARLCCENDFRENSLKQG